MKLFDKRIRLLEDAYRETGTRVALIANDEDKEESLRKVELLHDSGPAKHMDLIMVLLHPKALPGQVKYSYIDIDEEQQTV